MHTNHHKTLLPEACLRFVYAKPMADCVVVAAAEELVSLGPSTIFSADRPDLQDRYKEAEFHFREKVGFDVFKVAKRLPELVSFTIFTIVHMLTTTGSRCILVFQYRHGEGSCGRGTT